MRLYLSVFGLMAANRISVALLQFSRMLANRISGKLFKIKNMGNFEIRLAIRLLKSEIRLLRTILNTHEIQSHTP